MTPSGPSSSARRSARVAAVRPVVVEAGRVDAADAAQEPEARARRAAGPACRRDRRGPRPLPARAAITALRAPVRARARRLLARGRDERCRRPVALAEAGAPEPGRRAVRPGPALGAQSRSSRRSARRPRAAAGDVVADVDDPRRAPVGRRARRRWRRRRPRRAARSAGSADVVERAGADPADVLWTACAWQEQVATLLRPVRAARPRPARRPRRRVPPSQPEPGGPSTCSTAAPRSAGRRAASTNRSMSLRRRRRSVSRRAPAGCSSAGPARRRRSTSRPGSRLP